LAKQGNKPVTRQGTLLSSALAAGLLLAVGAGCSAPGEPATLELVQTIPLEGPAGRLDHLAIDSAHARLFVANMANSSLDVVDLKAGKLVKQIPGQKGIQGIAYAPDPDRIFVGNEAGGICNAFDGRDYSLVKQFRFADDADNVRYEPRKQRIYVAHAERSLAVIDAKKLEIVSDIKVPGQPEAFQLEKERPRLYLNVPSARAVVVIDTEQDKETARYSLTLAGVNYPMALDEASSRIFVGCRQPASIVFLDSNSGKEVTKVTIPGDTDDVFFDARRHRLYASCGEGYLAVVRQVDADHYELVEKIATAKLARTCFFDPSAGRLYLVVPRQEGQNGPEIRVYAARP
jgi:DNA-binding beta-propeller fold protein YncE